MNEDPPGISQLVPNLPPALQRVVHRCLEKNPEQRFQSASDMAFALDALTDSGASVASRIGTREQAWPKWTWIATSGLISVAVIATSILAISWLRIPTARPRILATKQLTNDGAQKYQLITDGSRIYFVESTGPSSRLAQVSVAGGEVALTNVRMYGSGNLQHNVTSISSEGSEFLGTVGAFVTGEIWAFPVPAGSPRRVANLIGRDPAWAPDGRLFFGKGNDIWVAEHDGNAPRKLVTTADSPGGFQFSRDGIHIRFTLTNFATSVSSIWEVRLDGTGLRELLPGWNKPPAECCGKWTPDGKYFVFLSTRNNSTDVWALPEKVGFGRTGSQAPVQLTTGPLQIYGVEPSRDGKQVFVIGSQPKGELVMFDARTNQFVPVLGGISAGDVDYSRDAAWVTYVLYPEGTLWRSRADGSERLQLTYPPMQAALAHWSPDGRQIAFSGSVPGKPWRVFVDSADGGAPQPINPSEESETDPTWSADGASIAFGHNDSVVQVGDRSSIGMFDVKSRQITRVPGSQGFFAPRWSPDGRYIVALSGDNTALMLYDTQAKTWRQLLQRKELIGYITWSRDSASIYFDTTVTDQSAFYRLRVRDAKLDRVLDLKSYRLFPSQFGPGSWTGLAPGGEPLFVRDIGTSEIYAFDVDFP
jgi:Tol biopolymer transport system component